ncbi:MAG TPA: iron chelate uptake ABC transporter family permease subunit [Acholeplasmataceae bacterium]|nr:iron chelate uptake ABC transporter family permease subunit [Acholeplasmataceae bacterium]
MKRWVLWTVLILLIIASILIGVGNLDFKSLVSLDETALLLLFKSRIPRTISIIFTGVGMSVSGIIMQQLSRNKFVSPSTAATLDSAKFGVLIAMLLFVGSSIFVKMAISFVVALVGTFLFMRFVGKIKAKNILLIPLIGIVFGTIIDALTTFIAYRYNVIQSLSSYFVGDFSLIIEGRYEMLYLIVPLVIIAYIYAYRFSLAGMGEDFSKNLGLSYKKTVVIGLVIVALMTSSVLVTVGSIPFLGLIVPNIVTMYRGDMLKKNLIDTALFGSIFLLFTDIIGRVIIYPYEVPIGLTIGVLGSVIFIILLVRKTVYGK